MNKINPIYKSNEYYIKLHFKKLCIRAHKMIHPEQMLPVALKQGPVAELGPCNITRSWRGGVTISCSFIGSGVLDGQWYLGECRKLF